MSPQRRYNFSRKHNFARKYEPTFVEIISPSSEELLAYYEKAIAVEKASWKGRLGTALKNKERDRQFYYSFLRAACAKNLVRIFLYKIAGEYDGMIVCLEQFRKLLVLKMGYNEKWAKCSPGIHLTNESIKYAFLSNLDSYEFLGIAENWQNIWPLHSRSYSTVAYFPYSIHGMRALIGDFYRHILKRILTTF